MTKQFKVVMISSNPNSFGLYGHYLMARDGETWEVGRHQVGTGQKPWIKGEVISVPISDNGEMTWASLGVEIPRKIQELAPPNVIQEVWGSPVS